MIVFSIFFLCISHAKSKLIFTSVFLLLKIIRTLPFFLSKNSPTLYKFSHKMSNSFSRLCYTDIETVNLCMANFCRSRQSQLLAGGNKLKLVIYGTDTCKDCVDAKALLDAKGIRYLFLEFSDSIGNLKRFLKIRDTNPMFDAVKEKGGVGVPLFVLEDGTMTFDVNEVISKIENA